MNDALTVSSSSFESRWTFFVFLISFLIPVTSLTTALNPGTKKDFFEHALQSTCSDWLSWQNLKAKKNLEATRLFRCSVFIETKVLASFLEFVYEVFTKLVGRFLCQNQEIQASSQTKGGYLFNVKCKSNKPESGDGSCCISSWTSFPESMFSMKIFCVDSGPKITCYFDVWQTICFKSPLLFIS